MKVKLNEKKLFYAFDEKQFKDGLKELKCKSDDVSSIGDGIYVLNSHLEELNLLK